MLAQREGLRIHEVAVDWIDDPDSRVDIVATALADLRGMARLSRCTWSVTCCAPRIRSIASLKLSAERIAPANPSSPLTS